MHGLNVLPIAKEFKQRLPNYLPDWSLASGAMLIRVTVGRLGTRSLKKNKAGISEGRSLLG